MRSRSELRPRRAWRRLRRGLVAGGVLAVAVLAVWFGVVPGLVEARLRTALEGAGMHGVRLRLAALRLSRAELHDLALGGGALRAQRVVARFAPSDLLAGRVDVLRIEGAVFDRSVPWPRDPRPAQEAAPAGRTALPALPVARLELADARVVSGKGGQTDAVVDLVLDADAKGWRARARVAACGCTASADLELRQSAGGGEGGGGEGGGGEGSGGEGERTEPATGPVVLRIQSGTAPGLLLRGHATLAVDENGRTLGVHLRSADEPFELAGCGGAVVGAPGTLALQAHVPLAAVGEARVSVTASGLALRAGDAWRLEGAGCDVDVGAFAPLRSAAVDEMRWDALVLGETAFGAGRVHVAFEPGPAARVDSLACALPGGGTIAADAFRIGPRVESITTVVHLDGASLEPWLPLVSRGRVTGAGRVDGQLHVRLDLAPRLALDVRGQLRARDGGVLRVGRDPATRAVVREHAAVVGRAAGEGAQAAVEDRIVEALEEFAFDELALRFVPAGAEPAPETPAPGAPEVPEQGAETTLRVHVAGKGLRVQQELSLDVAFNGFDSVVDLLLATKLGLDRARGRLDGADPDPGSERDDP